MPTPKKTLSRILSGSRNVRFNDMVKLIEAFGFRLSRTSGSHQIFTHTNIPELVNLQNVSGEAKPYQIRQFLQIVERHNLQLGE